VARPPGLRAAAAVGAQRLAAVRERPALRRRDQPAAALPGTGLQRRQGLGRFPEQKVRACYRQRRQQAAAKRQARRAWDAHCAQLKADGAWDADGEWDATLPQLAYGTAAAAQA